MSKKNLLLTVASIVACAFYIYIFVWAVTSALKADGLGAGWANALVLLAVVALCFDLWVDRRARLPQANRPGPQAITTSQCGAGICADGEDD